METEISSVEDLRKLLCSNNRIKFMTKILHILRYVSKHPQEAEDLGASWLSDNTHFITHSNKIGSFLGLKANSINTNFRDHGVIIKKSTVNEIKTEFPYLRDQKNWKKRVCQHYNFNSKSTISDSDSILLIENEIQTSTKSDEKSTSLTIKDNFPHNTSVLLSGEQNKNQVISIKKMLCDLAIPQEKKNELLSVSTSLWVSALGNLPYCSLETALMKFIPDDSSTSQEKVDYMRTNFVSLNEYESNTSQIEADIPFSNRKYYYDQFFKYFVRYGSHKGIVQTLEEITPNSFHNYYYLQNENRCSFSPGFNPHLSKREALDIIRTRTLTKTWMIIHSKQINKFSLLFFQPSLPVYHLYVTYDAVPDSPDHRFSIDYQDSNKYAATWDELLFKVLGLSENCGVILTHNEPIVEIVKGEQIEKESKTPVSYNYDSQTWNLYPSQTMD